MSEDVETLMIDRSKFMANGEKYFKLFEKHVPRGINGTVLLLSIGNLDCMDSLMALNKDAKYLIIDNNRIAKAANVLFSEKYDLETRGIGNEDLLNLVKGLDMKFDCIIMNPPYSKSLPLKILKEVISSCEKSGTDYEIVNLSPNFYEDYKKLDNAPLAANINVLPREEASRLFCGIQLPFNLAIQYYTNGKGDKSLLTKFMPSTYIILKKIKFDKSFKDVFIDDYDGHGVFVPLKLMTATWDKNKDYIADKLGILVDGKTLDGIFYKDKRNRNKDRLCGGIKFDTVEEAKNFEAYTKTKFFVAWVKAFHANSRYILSEYPFMPTYKHPWTDKDLYEYFELTPEEIKEIEESVK